MSAGAFVCRSFESMLKECSGKKYIALQNELLKFLDSIKEVAEAIPTGDSVQTSSSNESENEGNDVKEIQPESAESDLRKVDAEPVNVGRNVIIALGCAGKTLEDAEVELVLHPIRLAIETKNVKILESSLDCLHKLIEYDHLDGDPGLEGGKNSQLFTDVLNIVCNTIDNFSPDSTVLHVLKVLLTAVASSNFRVHGESLLGVLRVCYNVALHSKSPVNQATSKAMLSHMISIIFRRMEADHVIQDLHSSVVLTSDDAVQGKPVSPPEEQRNTDITDSKSTSENSENHSSLASVEELQNLAVGADIKGLEAALDKAVHTEDGKKITRGLELESLSIGQRDALLVFRTLCKMGMKEDSDEVTVKTRILSLELLQGLLEGVTHSFTKNFHFIDSVKAYLSYALLRASMSQSPVIFQYASGIFSVLLLRFRESLKGEIGIFFPLVILRSLDSSECPTHQKNNVLRMLEKVCKDPQMLVDVYVNYDCDLEAPNLFERLVTNLSKFAQGIQGLDLNTSATTQYTSVKGSALQCLVSVLKSLVQWEKSRRDSNDVNDFTEASEPNYVAKEPSEVRSRDEISNNFEKAKAHKSTMEAAVAEFNRKPTKGVDYLFSNKLVESNPESVAKFIKNTQSLDKAMIGDYLGHHEAFPLAVMHAFVDSLQFQGMKFDVAIRELLKRFRLPGEAQKIDRIMEKFAAKYCADNPGLFKNADTAYVLAYAVIMLNTDAHNPMVWPKMSKADFIRMNETNEREDSAPSDLLEAIYDSIVKEEIKMKDEVSITGRNTKLKSDSEERGGLVGILNLALPKRKLMDANTGNEAIIRQTQEIFRKQGVKRGIFYSAQQIEIVRPMVEAVGWPLLATFSVTMEEGENKPRVALCMEGFASGINITHVLGMDTMRYAFLTSLVRYTFLHAPRDLRSKNAEALRTLLNLCNSKPDSLQDTWNAVLECVSRLDFISSTPSISATVMHGSNQISKDAVLQTLRELSGKPAEQVFVNSSKLPSDSVVEFFNALCGVSAEELRQSPARVYSLQKLVEISYYNMARIRMVWARIWSVLSCHFIFAGSHQDEKIAMYAIDSLRQLGMKYLERAELANFTFQNDILKPFVVLMRNSRSERIRRLILDCIVQMIKSKVGSIKSGWHSVFMVFTAAADDGEEIVDCAFENVEQVVLEHFDQVVGDCFMDCVNSLIRFANNKSSYRISLKAIALLRICEVRLAEGFIPGGLLKPIDDDQSFDVTEHYWFPMLAGLSDLTSDLRPEVRSCAVEVLFDLLNERGKKFSPSFWESIFHRVLFPIFDNVRHAGQESLIPSDDEWFRESSIHSLQLLCNLFNTFYKEVCFMLPPLLSLLLDCAKKTDQTVVSIAMGALVHLINVGGHLFTNSDWNTLLTSLRDAAFSTRPIELLISSVESLGNPTTAGNSEIGSPNNDNITSTELPDHVTEITLPTNLDASEGLPSPSRNSPKPVEADSLQKGQTFGQKLMDNLLLRSFTSKAKVYSSEASLPSSPNKITGDVEVEDQPEEAIPVMTSVRGKCTTQLLLLGAIDSIQKKFWENLNYEQRASIMEILLSILEFAASYNSSSNLRSRMLDGSSDRPPHNLLRQELAGTTIYLNVLQRATSSLNETEDEHLKIKIIAEEKLVSFCQNVLEDASDLQKTADSTSNLDIHFVLNLRSPVVVKVLKDMCVMDSKIFRRHLKKFYPLLTKLVCCDQMDLRGALSDLFKLQLQPLVP